ncbi:uncharacterized protein LOC143265863 [Megachile rotundata]|uniref:uncharacterized protein LOC143265863 n=1 Tax=Megachile rotundata TaxID=143995 RepID=UPI003FD054A1
MKADIYLKDDRVWENMVVEIETEKGKLEIVLVYRRPGTNISREDCRRLFRGMGRDTRRMFIGDFNAKSISWNCEGGDLAGSLLEEVMDEEEMVVVNFGTKSRIGGVEQAASNIDLIVAPAGLALDLEVRETGETLGSDHQVIEFDIYDEMRLLERRIGGRRFKMEKVDKAEFLKWMLGKEEILLRMVKSEIGVERKCDEVLRLLVEGIEGSYRGNARGNSSTNGTRRGREDGGGNRVNGNRRAVKRQPWWDGECEELKEGRRKATKEMGRRPSEENWNKLLEARKKMKITINKKKKEAWEEFIKSIKHKGNIGEMWRKIKSLTKGVTMEEQNGLGAWKIQEMEETEVRKLEVSGYCCRIEEEEGAEVERNEGRNGTETESIMDEEMDDDGGEEEGWISRDLEIEELQWALATSRGKSAPGEDGIGYEVIKLWTKGWKEAMLGLYNEIWRKGIVPKSWKKAVVKFIPKVQKRALRPISLLNCMGKVLEKMINERIRIWAEEEDKIDTNQNGFRKGRSTMDNIGILTNRIKESWGKGRKVVAAFVDVKSAYDNVRHDIMIQGLVDAGCPGRMRKYVEAWLRDKEIAIHTMGGNRVRMKLKKRATSGVGVEPLVV